MEIQLIVFQSSIDLEKERKDSEKSLKYKQKLEEQESLRERKIKACDSKSFSSLLLRSCLDDLVIVIYEIVHEFSF